MRFIERLKRMFTWSWWKIPTATRVEMAWKSYLESKYKDRNYIGRVTPDDIDQMVRTGRFYGELSAENKGINWRSLTFRQRNRFALNAAVECAFTQMFGSVDAGREKVTPGVWEDESEAAAWVATLAALKAKIEEI